LSEQCPYCGNTYLQGEETHIEESNTSLYYSLCVLCGWARTVTDVFPTEEHLERIQKWKGLTWYSIVDVQGNRCCEWDFEDSETAGAVAEVMGGSVIEWRLDKDWDGMTLPNPYSAYMATLQEDGPDE
jgi:hypothetical protein